MTTDSLQEIIHSLDPTEKRYFKVFAATFKENSSLVSLFDQLDSEKTTNEKQVPELGKNLVAARSNLRRLILKAMRNYNEDRNRKAELRTALTDIEFLIGKQLYGEAEKEIKKALKKADARFNYPVHVELLLKENEIKKQYRNEQELIEAFLLRKNQLNQNISNLSSASNLTLLSSEWGRYVTNFGQQNLPLQQAFFIEHIESDAKKQLKENTSVLSTLLGNQLLSHYFSLFNNEAKANELIGDNMALFRSHEELRRDFFGIYFSMMYNHASALYQVNSEQESLTIINELETEFKVASSTDDINYSSDLKIRHRYALLSGKLRALCYLKQHSEALLLEQEFKDLTKQKCVTPNLITNLLLHIRFGSMQFHLKNYKEALSYINQTLDISGVKSIPTTYFICLMAQAICHYMLGDIDLAESKFQNLYKLIRSGDGKTLVAKTHMEFFRKIGTLNLSVSKHRSSLHHLGKAMHENVGDSYWKEFIEPAEWIQGLLIGDFIVTTKP